jgi:Uma2 family endonuclease
MSAQSQPRMSPEEYLAIERAAEFRSEYYDGHMYAMSGASRMHVLVTTNLSGELHQALKHGPCQVYAVDLRLRVNPDRLYTYPDISVVCGETKLADDHKDTLLNPTVLVEVLSPSTEARDRGFKFTHYRHIESLQEYVLVWQSEPRVEVYRRQSTGDWLFSEVSGLESNCKLASLGCEIPLAEIYYGVSFDAQL